ncbi:Molybdopterin biosynthesis protein MoeA [Brevibacterium yomogidense]|uniref:Molybdopterin molybdenumtransferase n=2 Tax=Brevibacterium yomogidense TaxID=946573 RepID=A0A1X6WVU7_9MICO|nr:Molybdopterin biosynthesis protein MoeA [Brevibacterium yomogidense]
MRLAYDTGAEAARARSSALAGSSAAVPLADAFGRTLAEDLRALFDVPHYDSSAMDGYAVSGPPPWTLDDTGPRDHAAAQAAPDGPQRAAGTLPELEPGRARTVVTGGVVPAGTSGVVRREYTHSESGEDDVRIVMRPDAPESELEPGRHVRRSGREAARGDVLASAGRPLTPPLLAMAGISGHDDVPVLPPVTAALLLTGDEVRTSGTPAAGEVRDAFEVQLPHVLRAAGIEVVAVRRIGDDRAVTRDALAELVDLADVIVTTGGTGRSDADHVRAVLQEEARESSSSSQPSSRLVIDELGMRPGHPTLLALRGRDVPAGTSRPVPVLALPGNPLAALAAMRIVGSAVLRGLRGPDPEVPLTVPAAQDLPAEKVDRLVPARPAGSAGPVPPGDPGTPPAPGTCDHEDAWLPVEHVASNMMRGLTMGRGWLVLPTRPVRAGERIAFLPLEW